MKRSRLASRMQSISADATHIYLVRHGTAEGVDGLAVGQIDLPLSVEGERAIRCLAKSWEREPPHVLISSDLARAVQTATILAESWQLEPRTDARLREMSFGEWDGRTWDELRRDHRRQLEEWFEQWWRRAPPGGESFAAVAARARSWLEQIRVDHAGKRIVTVAHGGTIRALLAEVLAMPIEKVFHLHLDHGRVSALATTYRGLEVTLVNSPSFQHEPL